MFFKTTTSPRVPVMSFIEYRALLRKVNQGFDWPNEGETLLSLCDGLISEASADNVVNAASLLKELEKQDLLGIDHLDILKALLRGMEKWTLIDVIKKFEIKRENYNSLLEKVILKLDELNDLTRLIKICKSILTEDGISRIDNVRALFKQLESKKRLGADCLRILKKILIETEQEDLLNEVNEFEKKREDEDTRDRQRMESEERNEG